MRDIFFVLRDELSTKPMASHFAGDAGQYGMSLLRTLGIMTSGIFTGKNAKKRRLRAYSGLVGRNIESTKQLMVAEVLALIKLGNLNIQIVKNLLEEKEDV